jgi:hypothetical protein
MSNRQHSRPTSAASTSREMSLARREANMAREQEKREAKRNPKAVRGECEVMGDRPVRRSAYRGESLPSKAMWKIRDEWDTFAPWVTTGGMWTGGTVTYLLHQAGQLSLGHVGAAGVVGVAAASLAAQRKLDGEERSAERWWVRVGATGAAGWLALATQIGTGSSAALLSLVAGGVVCGWKWYRYKDGQVQQVEAQVAPAAMPEAPAGTPVPAIEAAPERDPAELLLEYWQQQWTTVTGQMTNLKGSQVTAVKEHGLGHVSLTVKLVPVKQNQDTIINAAKSIETGLKTQDGKHLRPGALNIIGDKTDSTVVVVHIRQINPLAKILSYEDFRPHMPRTVSKPILMGKREDGTWDRQELLYTNWAIGADIDGGKSNQINTLMANLALMDDVVIWGADMKGGRALGPWLPRIDWLATGPDEVGMQLRSLNAIIDYRQNEDVDSDKITPRVDLPAIVYIIDEGAEVTGTRVPCGLEFAKQLERINSLGRALAISIVYATQYCSLESFQSAILREQFTTRFLLRTQSKLAASFVLGDDAWGKIKISDLNVPGMYFKRVGETEPLAARTPLMTPNKSNRLCTQIAWEGARTAPGLDAGSASVAVPEYASRRSRLPDHLIRMFSSESSPVVIEGGSRGVQDPIPGTDVTGGSRGVLGAGENRPKTGVPAVSEQGSRPAPEGGSHPVPEGGFPGGSRPVPDDSAREAYDRIWGSGATAKNVVPIDAAAARRAAAAVDMDAVFGAAKVTLARVLVTCPEDGVTRKEIQEATGMGHDWVSVRCNQLAQRGVCFAPRGIQGRYRAVPGIAEVNILAVLDAIEGELKEARRRAREAAGAQS